MRVKDGKILDADYTQAAGHRPRNYNFKFLVIHFTAGRSFKKSLRTLTENDVSAHFLIGREGELAQMVNLYEVAYHAGKSAWKGLTGINNYSIGIELDNAGKLTPKFHMVNGDREIKHWVTWFGEIVDDPSEVYEHVEANGSSTWWHAYTHDQLEVLWDLAPVLFRELNLEEVVGHSDIAPGRKVDPGPAFPMEELRLHVKP